MPTSDIIANTGQGGKMTPERWRVVREVFEQAVARGREQRTALLDEACLADQELRHEVEQLLLAHDATGRLLAGPAIQFVNPPSGEISFRSYVGRQIGAYLVVRELGHGGMGAVYLAERTIGRLRQQVALKIVRPSVADTAEVIRRFHQEREILASLDHPNIARLLDLGNTEDGLPFLVMDYVDGEPIDVYCDGKKLTIRERLQLFRTVCGAVQYAHTKGVIHRDLKPSNILVTHDGIVKLLDFGIAKLLHSETEQRTILTRTGLLRPMTVEYASPEQVKGEDLTIATDVYSLAVVLYELLTGHRPFRVEKRLLHEVVRLIAEEPPAWPSVVVGETATRTMNDGTTSTVTPDEVSARRADRPSRLQKRLKGDIDSILIKALRKEKVWRYPSIEAFSEDIRRHLEGLPVTAHKDTLRYRAQKFVHRLVSPRSGMLHNNSIMFIGWGAFGFAVLIEKYLIAIGWRKDAGVPFAFYIMGWIMTLSIVEGRRMVTSGRSTAVDRQASVVFGVTLGWLGVLTILSAINGFISERVMCLLWNAGISMALLIGGLQASRVLMAGGIVLLASVVIANFDPDGFYLWLAFGVLFGVGAPGVLFAVENPPVLEIEPLPHDQIITLNLDVPER
jgi:serine/threonine protein kinase